MCWFNNKEYCVLHVQSNSTIFYLKYSKNTTTCFGPICGPSSGCDLTYRAAIKDGWGVFEGVGDLVGVGERDLVVSIVGTVT